MHDVTRRWCLITVPVVGAGLADGEKQEYGALGEDFEKKERRLFGKEGFEGIVERVGAIEKSLGIYDLRQFTPK